MVHFGKDRKPERIVPKVSQETLAEMIGTTRSRVSLMNWFRKLGFVKYNGEDLEVHNSLLNVVLHDNPHLREGDRRSDDQHARFNAGSTTWMEGKLFAHALSLARQSGGAAREHVALRELPCRSLSGRSKP